MSDEKPWGPARARLFLSGYAASLRETVSRIEVSLDQAVQSEQNFRMVLEAAIGLDGGDIDGAVREAGLRRCRRCGCTEEDCSGCVDHTGEPCSWVEEDLCSSCSADDFDTFEVYGERVYFADFGSADLDRDEGLDKVPLIPNHADVDSVDLEVQALPTIYLDSELGRYFYVAEEVRARSYVAPGQGVDHG